MNNPFGRCTHTKYNGSAPCVHDAWVRGVRDAVQAIHEYEKEIHRHSAGATGMCNPYGGDRCDVVAALRVMQQRLWDGAEESWKDINR